MSGAEEKEPVVWEIVHVSLGDPSLSYKAFSYTWGNPSTIPMPLFLSNHTVLPVSTSIGAIVLFIISTRMLEYFWLDALSIDQMNVEEKGVQVRIMGDIYASATEVMVYLGWASNDSDMAMLFIPVLCETFQRLEDLGKPISTSINREPVNAPALMWPSEHWFALQNLLQRAWFQRAWIVQEVVMGAKVSLYCGYGAQPVEWSLLVKVVETILVNSLTWLLGFGLDEVPSALAQGLTGIGRIDVLRGARQHGVSMLLEDILFNFISFRSTDPKDKIYALLALTKDGTDAELGFDYTVSTKTLYIRSSHYLLRHSKSLQILHAAGIGYPRSVDGLPSWVPDFSLTRGAGNICNYFLSNHYKASGDFHVSVWQDSSLDRIAFKGILVDRIKALSSMPQAWKPGPNQGGHHFSAWLNSIADMISTLPPSATGTPNHEIFWRTVIANKTHESKPVPPEYAQYYESWVAVMNRRAGKIREMTSKSDLEHVSQTTQESSIFASALLVNLTGRQAFVTDNGYAGLTFPETMEGDAIYIFLGANTPFILRKNLSREGEQVTYQLVGESYVYGFMDGEGLEMGKMEEIVLT